RRTGGASRRWNRSRSMEYSPPELSMRHRGTEKDHYPTRTAALAGTWFLFWGARAVGPLVQEGCLELFGGVAGGFGIVLEGQFAADDRATIVQRFDFKGGADSIGAIVHNLQAHTILGRSWRGEGQPPV